MRSKCTIIVLGCLMLVLAVMISCQSGSKPTAEQKLLMDKTYEMFTRVKARDYRVIYDYEYPYYREAHEFEEFLQHPWVVQYDPDTIMACEIDSASVDGDTAYVYMKMEYLLSDGSYSNPSTKLRYVKVDDQWFKPSLSSDQNQQDYEDELKVYWDAVNALKKSDGDSTDVDTTGQ